jgi:hypothetical protein
VQVSFAMLEFLAKRPEGRGTFDDIYPALVAREAETTPGRFSDLDSIDALQAGLVVEDTEGLKITEAGRSVLRALEALANSPAETEQLERSQSLKLIDDLIGSEMRQKIFDLGLRTPAADNDLPEDEEIEPKPEFDLESYPEPESVQNAAEAADSHPTGEASDTTAPSVSIAPAFLKRDYEGTFSSSARTSSRTSSRSSLIASKLKRFGGILRGHIEQGTPTVRTSARGSGIGGIVLSVLAPLVLVICAGTVIAITQIKSLKSEITTLERQLVPLKKLVAEAEQPKNNMDQKPSPSLAAADKGKPNAELRPSPPSLTLSPDEMRLIREYIKPAPFTGPAAPPINVGDSVTIGTIPLPSPLMEKVPKLHGARFTIRNGAIIILKRDSRQADAVVGPN